MGISTSAMDERIKQWGIIRECPIADIPLLIEDEQGRRPADRLELKELLKQKGGFHGEPKSYQHELARRLFGGEENFQEVCRFLAMGKAYREIASQSADYHELFKSLLPEPKTEIFERIIDALRTLDQSKSILDDLERKLHYLKSLQSFTLNIAADSEASIRYQWLSWLMRETFSKNSIETLRQQIASRQQEMAQLIASRQQEEETEASLRTRLDDLMTKDSAGLVRQEKEGREELSRKERTLAKKKKECQNLSKIQQASTRKQAEQHHTLVRQVSGLHSELGQGASLLPFSISQLLTTLDTIGRSEEIITQALDFGVQEFSNLVSDTRDQALRQLTLLEQEGETISNTITDLTTECHRLRAMDEAQPILPGWTDCLAAMRTGMLNPRPLYSGLEWRPGLSRQEQETIEESIGQEIAATLVLSDPEFEAGRGIAILWPGIRISCPGRGLDSLPDWMRTAFDLTQSNPTCLRCLAAEMQCDFGPLVSVVNNRRVLSFRSHDRGLLGNPARLIGENSRREAIKAEIKGREDELRQWSRQQTELNRRLKTIRETVERLDNFTVKLSTGINSIQQTARLASECSQKLTQDNALLTLHNRQHEELARETTLLSTRIQDLTHLISSNRRDWLPWRARSVN